MKIFTGRPLHVLERHQVETAVYDLLDRIEISYSTATHSPAFTMEACRDVEKALDVDIPKNLFLTNKQQSAFYLLLMPGSKVFKTKYLSSQLGCSRLSFATDEKMEELLHIHPGSVSPFGLMNDTENRVKFIIDRDLLADEYVGCHPCLNSATVKLSLSDLLNTFLPAVGHNYTIVDLPSPETV